MIRTIHRYEHGRLLIGQEGFEKPHWDAFVKLNTVHGSKYFTVLHNGLQFNQYVGVIQVDGILVQINPKADKDDADDKWQGVLLKMLKRCGHIKAQTAGNANVKRQNLNLLEVYFEQYLLEVQKLIRTGLVKKYRKQTSNVKALKGKLEFSGHIQKNTIHKERFYTTHQVYDVDHSLHQIMNKALQIVDHFSNGTRLSDLSKRVCLSFPELKEAKVTKQQIDFIELNRKTNVYERAFELARLIILNYSPDINSGKEKMVSLLFDMNVLWEEYVLVMLRKHVRENELSFKVKSQVSLPFWGSNSLKPDIELINTETKETTVIDTKWKRPGDSSASIQDLRQMYAYGRYWKAKKVMLLYPGELKNTTFKEYKDKASDLKVNCKMGFVSVLSDAGILDENLGEKIWSELFFAKQNAIILTKK